MHDPNDPQGLDIYWHPSGTSFSSPYAAGVAALLLSYDPSLTAEQVRQVLRKTAVDRGDWGFDALYGYGRIDARAALDYVVPGLSRYNICEALILQPEDGPVYRLEDGFSLDIFGIAGCYYMRRWQTDYCYAPEYAPTEWVYVASGTFP